MTCPACAADLPGSTRFCPRCGSPGAGPASEHGGPDTRRLAVGEAGEPTGSHARSGVMAPPVRDLGGGTRPEPYPAEPTDARRDGAGSTTVLPSEGGHRGGHSVGERIGPASRAVRAGAQRWAERFGALPLDLRLALVGTVVAVLSFLWFDYSVGVGDPVDIAGRLWLRPIAAVTATALLYGSLHHRRVGRVTPATTEDAVDVPRHVDGLLAAVVVAAAGTVEAGLVGLLTGDVVGPRAGFYGMLLGLVLVLAACVRAARRTLR